MFRRVVLTLAALLVMFVVSGPDASAQDIPREVFKAKTIWIVNQTGKTAVENGADAAISKWGRFTLADDPDTADLRIVIFKTGATESQSQTTDAQTGKQDQNFSTSFTLGVTAHAYLKGQKLYFWTGSSSSSGEKAGKGVVEDFKKLFPKD